MRSVVPLLLVLSCLCIIALIHQQVVLAGKFPSPPPELPQNITIMSHQQVSLTSEWDSMPSEPPLIKKHVVVKTTFREPPHQSESHAEFIARHDAEVATMLESCPNNCP